MSTESEKKKKPSKKGYRPIRAEDKELREKESSESPYVGKFISLNMKKASFFGVGEREDGTNKVWLSSSNWCDQIPEDINNQDLNTIIYALNSETIVFGKEWIPALEKDENVKTKYISYLTATRVCDNQFKDKIRHLVSHKKEGNYTALEILREMIKKEKEGRSRPDFLNFLNDAIDHYVGPVSLVQDYPDDPENFSVEIDPISKTIVSTTKKGGGSLRLEQEPVSSEDRTAAIENALG